MKRCKECGARIPKGRLIALPDTETCIHCARPRPRTTAEVEVDGPAREDMIQQAQLPDKG